MTRLLLISVLLLCFSNSFSQKLERNVVVAFLESNVKAIIDFDSAKRSWLANKNNLENLLVR